MAQASFHVHMVFRGLYLWLWCRYHVVTTFIILSQVLRLSAMTEDSYLFISFLSYYSTARKARHGRKWVSERGRRRMRLDAVFEPEIGPKHNRSHVSRNKFSGYRIYFRCAGRRPVPDCTTIGDVFGCRCNL
ncbi:PREDICTED: uncharacterized protein LOC105145567 isoform X2 [Acromyrmex echinatior]|uniref:uncharacterized protein LOC105145567 isoform X2 n=1 Tax=Acromyrmex echinatior TaxID=103372 RepID=UPI000580F6B9|nr:PREDICTED: uncharacterized protein LOC105145567 isoform X2 [Acromyrmex echinatior]